MLRFVEDSVKAQDYLNEFVVDFALYQTIQTALGETDSSERQIYSRIAAECIEMLVTLRMHHRSKVFPLDYIDASQLLKDHRLASKVARAGVFDDLITSQTGYMLKLAPLLRFQRDPEAGEELLEIPHATHFFLDAIARDIPTGVAYIDLAAAAGGLHMLAATATGNFGASTSRRHCTTAACESWSPGKLTHCGDVGR